MIKFIKKLLSNRSDNTIRYSGYKSRVYSKTFEALNRLWKDNNKYDDDMKKLQKQYAISIVSLCLNFENGSGVSSRFLLSAVIDTINELEYEEIKFNKMLEHDGSEVVQ